MGDDAWAPTRAADVGNIPVAIASATAITVAFVMVWSSCQVFELLRAVAREPSKRDRKRPYFGGRRSPAVFQDLLGCDACSVHVVHVLLVRRDDRALELQ